MRLSIIRELVNHAIDTQLVSTRREALEYLESLRWREDRYWEADDERHGPDPDRMRDDWLDAQEAAKHFY